MSTQSSSVCLSKKKEKKIGNETHWEGLCSVRGDNKWHINYVRVSSYSGLSQFKSLNPSFQPADVASNSPMCYSRMFKKWFDKDFWLKINTSNTKTLVADIQISSSLTSVRDWFEPPAANSIDTCRTWPTFVQVVRNCTTWPPLLRARMPTIVASSEIIYPLAVTFFCNSS